MASKLPPLICNVWQSMTIMWIKCFGMEEKEKKRFYVEHTGNPVSSYTIFGFDYSHQKLLKFYPILL